MIVFGVSAELVSPEEFYAVDWDYAYGSNLAAAVELGRLALAGQGGRLLLVSDLYSTAHTQDGEVKFGWPPLPETVERTVDAIMSLTGTPLSIQAVRCRNDFDHGRDVADVVQDAILASGGTVEELVVPEVDAHRADPSETGRYAG